MKTLTLSLLLAATLVVPAAAQRMGSVNRGAPSVSSSITFPKAGKLSIEYTALAFGQGAFLKNVKENARFREFLNTNAKENPVGKLTLPAAMTMGGKDLAAGEYGIHFLVNDDGKWMLTLSHKKGEEVSLTQWELALAEDEVQRARLVMLPVPGSKDGEAALHIHFGGWSCDVAMMAKKD